MLAEPDVQAETPVKTAHALAPQERHAAAHRVSTPQTTSTIAALATPNARLHRFVQIASVVVQQEEPFAEPAQLASICKRISITAARATTNAQQDKHVSQESVAILAEHPSVTQPTSKVFGTPAVLAATAVTLPPVASASKQPNLSMP